MARMLRIAISGHRGLTGTTAALVDKAIRAALAEHAPGVTGISCLADGADQIFARAVTDLGGQLEVIVPAAEYRDRLPEEAHCEYDGLLAQATAIRRLPLAESTSESHMKASKDMIDGADELYAVWDGQHARAYGGTADVVAYAREHGTPVRVIWPHGAQRDLRQDHLFTRERAARRHLSLLQPAPRSDPHRAAPPPRHGVTPPAFRCGDAVPRCRQRCAVGRVLVRRPAGADPQHQPALADLVQGGRHVRHDCRVPVGIAQDQASQCDSRRLLRQRGQDHPAFQHRPVRRPPGRIMRHEWSHT